MCDVFVGSEWATTAYPAMVAVRPEHAPEGHTCNVPPSPPEPPGPPPPPPSLISWSTGPCVVHGDCVCSSNHVGSDCDASGAHDWDSHESYEYCSISFAQEVMLSVHLFDTESCCDRLTVNGYDTYGGSDGPDGVMASSMSWSSDYSANQHGFKICATAAPPSPSPPPPPPPSPVCTFNNVGWCSSGRDRWDEAHENCNWIHGAEQFEPLCCTGSSTCECAAEWLEISHDGSEISHDCCNLDGYCGCSAPLVSLHSLETAAPRRMYPAHRSACPSRSESGSARRLQVPGRMVRGHAGVAGRRLADRLG